MEKAKRYEHIYNQCIDLVKKENNFISKLSTIASLLHHKMDGFFWTGFYLLDPNGELWVGPYQGSVACQKLARPNGVCWTAIIQQSAIVVPNVHEFPGHIACDSRSNSEIAVPLKTPENKIIGVLDVDSKEFNWFDETDAEWLQKMISIVFS
ncbi:MAG TPA: GAF domain-containing protein [Bacteroidales bacterium]|mgnify:FL=1|jgi:GAF domain-containing protein|nr:GAF domain-containing protein [Bacteroidales bacterium]HOU98802.1 GAF domain-containing protein [Bacteroidales bacterium]